MVDGMVVWRICVVGLVFEVVEIEVGRGGN
jgi:hypothetical protein